MSSLLQSQTENVNIWLIQRNGKTIGSVHKYRRSRRKYERRKSYFQLTERSDEFVFDAHADASFTADELEWLAAFIHEKEEILNG